MAEDSGQERTEQATTKKREDARKKGQVCQSREVTSAALLLFGIGFCYFFLPSFVRALVDLNRSLFARCAQLPLDHGTLAALAALSDDPRLVEYQPYWATRAALLAATGAVEAADAAYHRAIALQSDPTVRRFLESQRAALPAR